MELQSEPDTPERTRIGVNHDWQFMKRRVEPSWFESAPGADPVDLPHCWNDRDTFQVGVRYYQGDGAYQRSFRLPEDLALHSDGHWVFASEGFYGIGDLWLNGQHVADIDGQYLGIRQHLDLKPFGINTLGIRLDNRYHPHVLPGKKMPDFLLHGGLAGRAFLEFEPAFHLDDAEFHVSCLDPMNEHPTLKVSVPTRNDSPERRHGHLRATVLDPNRDEIAHIYTEPFSLGPGAQRLFTLSTTVDNPMRWSLETPHRYAIRLELVTDDCVVDLTARRFGIREATFREDGFFLNGERVRLRGANRHESMPGFGNALPLTQHREDASLIKESGLNLVRLSHYPQHPCFLDACDKLGILVYAEIASWKSVKQGPWLAAACRQMKNMILRDRHHPSIVLWGMGNESRSGPGYRVLRRIAHELDGTRQTIYAENHLHRGLRWRTLKIPDVLGVNYEIDRLQDAARLSRSGAVLVSECSNCPRTYRGDPDAENRQIETYTRDLDSIEDHDFAAGYCLWSFNDYATQRKERFIRCSGIVDAWRIAKPAARYLASRNMQAAVTEYATHGPPARITLEPEDTQYSCSSRQTASLYCHIVDESGGAVADWAGDLVISIEGPAVEKLHNGSGRLSVSGGVARLFVRSTGQPGIAQVTASHESLGEGHATISFAETPDALPEIETADRVTNTPLPTWSSFPASSDASLSIFCAPGEESLRDLLEAYWSNALPDLETIREHGWGGRVQSYLDPENGRTLFFKRFAVHSPRYLHKPLRARHTILQEAAIRAAGFDSSRAVCLAEKRVAGILVDGLVVSEGAGELTSVFSLVNETSHAGPDRRALLKAVAREIGRFHRSGLFHGDMHLNNLLCKQENGRYRFTWIDNEEGQAYDTLPYEKRIHDLNHVNRYKHTLTRSERMLMWKTYLDAAGPISGRERSHTLRAVISKSRAYMKKRGWL